MKNILIVLAALSLAPTAFADSGSYMGAGVATGFCDPVGTGSDLGIVCELACPGSCIVTMTDDLLGEGGAFEICDWNGAEDVNCSDILFGQTAWTSTTGVIDIFIVAGTTGIVTAE